MTKEQNQFIEGLGQHMTTWGLPRTTGRLYGYLLLRTQAASLDEIATTLEVAKSGASIAARQLMSLGLARSISQRGSRRVLYEALNDPEAIYAARHAQTLDLVARLRHGGEVAPAGPPRQRLEEMAAVVQELTDEIPVLLQRIRARRQGRQQT